MLTRPHVHCVAHSIIPISSSSSSSSIVVVVVVVVAVAAAAGVVVVVVVVVLIALNRLPVSCASNSPSVWSWDLWQPKTRRDQSALVDGARYH